MANLDRPAGNLTLSKGFGVNEWTRVFLMV